MIVVVVYLSVKSHALVEKCVPACTVPSVHLLAACIASQGAVQIRHSHVHRRHQQAHMPAHLTAPSVAQQHPAHHAQCVVLLPSVSLTDSMLVGTGSGVVAVGAPSVHLQHQLSILHTNCQNAIIGNAFARFGMALVTLRQGSS